MKQDRSAMEPSPGEQSATAAMPTWDYVSRGLRDPRLKRLFPQMVAGDRSQNAWPYLRSEIPHSWYVDARFPTMGFLSLDEATLLHALALPFAGKPALEIGCWRGWSTAHLLSAGVVLDVVDPILADEGPREEIRAIARGLGAADRAALHGARSPEGIVEAAERRGEPWSFIFIDGDHEAPGPFLDAVAVAPCAADDAMIVFHDLASPHVAAGLDALRDLGWATRVFQTMQIMGVAWRGTAAPVSHHPDGRVSWTIPEHLQAYAFSGEDERARDERFRRVLERHSALLRELVFANEMAIAIPSRTGDFAMAGVWKKATAGPPGAPQPPLSAEGKKLFAALESGRKAVFAEVERADEDLRRIRLDHAAALEAVHALCAERAEARAEIDRVARELAGALETVRVREAEQTALRERADELVIDLESTRAELERVEAESAHLRQQVMELAPFANRAGRTQAKILRLLRLYRVLKP